MMTVVSTPFNLRNKHLGYIGETIATKYLYDKGYRIIERNYQKQYGELDIVALSNNTLIFVEVKTRIGDEFGLPEEAITPRKLREIEKTGLYYSSIHPKLPETLRIDVVAVELNSDESVKAIRHHENVTG
jgi:putative endonuclease